MAVQNLFDDLKKALTDFKTFLADKKTVIKPAIAPLDAMFDGKVSDLITSLVGLLNDLKQEINKLDPSLVPGLEDVTRFSQSVKTLVEASKSLLTEQTETINEVLTAVDVVGGLGALTGQVKQEVIDLIQAIIDDLNFLKAP